MINGHLKILIVDDHGVVRRGLKDILREEFSPELIVGEASTGTAALSQARDIHWDVVILDIAMPDQNGLTTLRFLKTEHPEIPVLMLSTHANLYYVQRSLQAGAAGFLSKESAAEEIAMAIRAVLQGHQYVSRDLA